MRLLLLLVAVVALGPGCANECDTACEAQADYFDRCIPVWGTTWVEQSYDDREDYLARCRAVYADQLDEEDEGSDEYRELLAICDGNLSRSESDTDCETLIE